MSEANTSEMVPMEHQRQRLSLLQRGLLICALIWALMMILPDTYRLFRPVGTLGFSADNDGIIFGIEDSPATQADVPGAPGRGLRAGDTIDLSRKPCFTPVIEECRSFLAVFGGMGGLVYVRSDIVVTLPVILGDAATTAPVSVSLKAQDHILDPTTKIFLLLILIAGVVVIWRSFTLVWDLPSRMTLGFFLYAIWFNPGPYYVFYAVLQRYPVALLAQEFLQSISQGAGYAGFLIFALRFPRNETEPRFQWVERLAVPIGVLLAGLQLSSFLNVFGLRTEILTRCAILGGYVVGVAVLIITFQRRKLQPPLDYQRMRWILWGCLIGLPAFIFADSNEATSLWSRYVWSLPAFGGWSPPEWLLEASFLLSGVLAMCVCEATRKPLVINIGYRLQGFAGFMVGVVAFAVFDHVFGERISEFLGELGVHESLQFAASICSAVICGFLGDRGGHMLSHALNRRFHRASERLKEIGAEISRADNSEAIEKALISPLKLFGLTSAAVFRGAEGVFRRMPPSPGWQDSDQSVFSPETSEALRKLLAVRKPIRFSHLPRDIEGLPNGAAFPAIAVPIASPDRLYAVAVYGPHETGDDIDPLEEEVLNEFAQHAVRGYEHSEVAALRQELASLHSRLGFAEGLGDPRGL
jgi:hypothetical protein